MKKNAGKIDLELAKDFVSDHYDTYLEKENPGGRSLCDHSDLDPQFVHTYLPFSPEELWMGK